MTKYPQAAETIAYLEGEGVRVLYGVDATRLGRGGGGGGREVREGWRGVGMRTDEEGEGEGEGDGDWDGELEGDGDGGERGGRRAAGWDKIVFNFPHVGGKTKDVNRQVRYNQGSCLALLSPPPLPSIPAKGVVSVAELLVSFFKSAIPLLAPSSPSSPRSPTATGASAIIVTLFESEPYTLWNIRDLARHVGLKVSRSFKFQASGYPGYKHARTLGNVDGVVGGGAWRGEERPARTYAFEVNGRDRAGGHGHGDGSGGGAWRRKRKWGESEDDEDD